MVINSFRGHGILLTGTGGCVIQGNSIGVDAASVVQANGGTGVRIEDTSDNSIGGGATAARNLISGNAIGVAIVSSSKSVQRNVVEGNSIGVNAAGGAVLGNSGDGVLISGTQAKNNTVRGNYIAGSGRLSGGTTGERNGVRIHHASDNKVQGNRIGVNAAGTATLAIADDGVRIVDGARNIIGGTPAKALGKQHGKREGYVDGGGLEKSDDPPRRPRGRVRQQGMLGSALRNTIAGSTNGVSIHGTAAQAVHNEVEGNTIGTNHAANGILGIKGDGVLITGAQAIDNRIFGNVIGGCGHLTGGAAGSRNGVHITAGAANNRLERNHIGVRAEGSSVLHITDAGVAISNASGNRIGGEVLTRRNVIAGCAYGVTITGSTATTTSNVVRRNYIGTSATGSLVLGNIGDGVAIVGEQATANWVVENRIAGSGRLPGAAFGRDNGVYIGTSGGNYVRGNWIGTGEAGTAHLPNEGHGLAIISSSGNQIGGTASGQGNRIAFNRGDGIMVITGTGNSINKNLIYSNDGVGIELLEGGNHELPSPMITSVKTEGSTTVRGLMRGSAGTSARVEVFSSTECDPLGYGEGETYLGFMDVTTDANGVSWFEVASGVAVSNVTVTATYSDGSTSKFSHCYRPLVVNETGDDEDADRGDGVCDHNTTAAGEQCTLRAAIQQANDSPEPDSITFGIPGSGVPSIRPRSSLPRVEHPVFLDATTQPGSARVELNGLDAGDNGHGLLITGGESTVQGMVVNRFRKYGIALVSRGNNLIEGNIIGTDAAGTTAEIGNEIGIRIDDSSNNIIGGSQASARNVISGNRVAQIRILEDGGEAWANIIQGNHIGVNAVGSQAIPGSQHGVMIMGAVNTTIGGTTQARNIISGHSVAGVMITSTDTKRARSNKVQGNWIGLDAAGQNAVENAIGVLIREADRNTIGGEGFESSLGNMITGNATAVVIDTGAGTKTRSAPPLFRAVDGRLTGTPLATHPARPVDPKAARSAPRVGSAQNNVIQGNIIGRTPLGDDLGSRHSCVKIKGPGAVFNKVLQNEITNCGLIGICESDPVCNGIEIEQATYTEVHGNAITDNLAGFGISVYHGDSTEIGDDTQDKRNLITFNGAGVEIYGESSENTVKGNWIGTDYDGNTKVGNLLTGIVIKSPGMSDNRVINNIIMGSGLVPGFPPSQQDIYLCDAVLIMDSDGNKVKGNRIGVTASGAGVVPSNLTAGVTVFRSSHNVVGGPEAADANLLVGNSIGVAIEGEATHERNVIQGNLIGAGATGSAVAGNRGNGVLLRGVKKTRILGNIIAGSGTAEDPDPTARLGIDIWSSDDTEILGNYIGTNADGDNLANKGDAIRIEGNNNVIGRIGEGNTIAFNEGIGIATDHGDDTISIRGNSIHSNTGLGIDRGIDGVTSNDSFGDDPPQNFPVISSVTVAGTSTTVVGTLHSDSGATYELDFYTSPECDPSGYGEGKTLLGSRTVTTDASGDYNISFTFAQAAQAVTATATSSDGATSEFSSCVTATGGP